MGVALRQASDTADMLFRLADEVSGLPIGELCASGPLEALTRTNVAQTAVVATSLAAAAVLEEVLGGPPYVTAVAGHSVGELAAMCWASALDVSTALGLVHERGRLMERDSATTDGTMVAVLGLQAQQLESICAKASALSGERVQVANRNAPGQVVLSGHRVAIASAGELALAAGARRVLPLSVGGPFHSVYMEAAAADFEGPVARAAVRQPRVPIVLNTTATGTTDPGVLKDELPLQITRPVRWEESLLALGEMGCDIFVELGPGQVLTGMVKRTLPQATALAAGNPETVAKVAHSLGVRGQGLGVGGRDR